MYNFRKDYYADVRMEDRFTTAVIYLDKRLDQARDRTEKRAFIRVYDGKRWYYSSVTDLTRIQAELDALYDMATPNTDIENDPIVKRFEVNKDTVVKYADRCVRNVSLDKKRALAQYYIDLCASSQYCAMSQVAYIDKHNEMEFYSSKGAEIKYDFQVAGLAFIGMLSKGEEKESFHISESALCFEEIANAEARLKKEIADAEDALLNAVPCEQGDFPVILSPMVTGVFAHESFGHKSESDFMIGDETMAAEWTLGKQIASPLLSIVDCGIEEGSGYAPYDDEGTKAKKNYLIKNGVLTGRLHSAQTAAALDEGLTGNARAMNATFEPIVRMTSTYVDGGESTFEELVSKISFGYYIHDYKHGSGMSTFTIAPNRAYEIKDGKITRPVRISVITGNVFETLGLIDGLSKDVEVKISVTGGCGKMEQSPLSVALGGPYVSISRMSVK